VGEETVSLRDWLRGVWHDPVWSKVIAAAVIAGSAYVWVRLHLDVAGLPAVSTSLVLAVATAAASVMLWTRWRSRRKTLVFLSAGGTGRDPMAKAITTKLLDTRRLKHPIDIHAVALGPVSAAQAEFAARYVIKEMYGEDLLADHKPAQLTPDLAKKADLILVMDRSLMTTPGKVLPAEKTFLLKAFLGAGGNDLDVVDPWPDGKSEATLARYRACAEGLRDVLTQNLDRLIGVLDL